MPFATSNIRRTNLGGGLKLTAGQWTGDVGDAAGTVTVQGGAVYGAEFKSNAAGGNKAPWTDAAGSAGNTRTLTVENIQSVTAGVFWILHA